MPSLFARYCLEKGMIVVENERGFMSAYVHNDTCMVDNFYVTPNYRGSPTCIRLADEVIRVAAQKGCSIFCAEVYKVDSFYLRNLKLFHHFGMEPVEDTEFKTVVAKSISGDPFYARQSHTITAH